jgi:GNAT superfamily N-acetyltransferase
VRYELRQATDADIEFVRELKCSGLRPYVEKLWGWDADDQERRFRASFVPDRQKIISYRGEDVGMLQVEEGEDSLVLAGLYVAAGHRSKGLGSAIIRDVLTEAARLGKPVRLRVLRPNPARALYERLGFRVVEESATHFSMEMPSAGRLTRRCS